MVLSRMETAGLSLETLIENLKKIPTLSQLDERERCRCYRDIVIYTHNFIELFFKAMIFVNGKEDRDIIDEYNKEGHKHSKNGYKRNSDYINMTILRWKLKKEKIVPKKFKEDNILNINKLRNELNHNAFSLDEENIYNTLKCLYEVTPLIIKEKEQLKINENMFSWIIDERNLVSLFIVMRPKVQEIMRCITNDREGGIRCNNHFINANVNDTKHITDIFYQYYGIENNDELKKTLEMLVKYNFIQECPSYDDYGNYESNGIIFRREGFNYNASSNTSFKEPGDYIKELFGIE